MLMLSITISGVLGLVAMLHFYWAFGGTFGLASAGPTMEGGVEFKPSALLTFVVACVITGLSVIALCLGPLIDIGELMGSGNLPYLGYLISGVFILRAIGDGRYIGMLKKVYNSRFAMLDTRYFSPLILFIGIGFLLLSLAAHEVA